MSDTQPTDELRLGLLLDQEITKRLDDLVRHARAAVEKLQGNTKLEKSQLRNLLNVAVESRSVEVVINFIRYQIARSGAAWGQNKDDFGHTVISDLRATIAPMAKEVTEKVLQEIARTATGDGGMAVDQAELQRRATITMMQRYLGYLNRAFTARNVSRFEETTS